MNWALVIGCDRYWTPEACLRGAVRDALAMRAWLLDPDGGAVPPDNLLLLLSPHPDGEQPPADVACARATNADIQRAHRELVERSGGRGERLYIYFSGHGLTGRVNALDEPAIVPEDFDLEDVTDRALAIRSIAEYFATTQIAEQFLLFDACRNIPIAEEFEVGRINRPRRSDCTAAAPDQFICLATSRGLRAVELGGVGDERGAFTSALLAGLGGDGIAKAWDRGTGHYSVRWDTLFAYVHASVAALRQQAGDRADLIQEPRAAGEHGSSNPELSAFPADAFAAESLDLDIAPSVAAPVARVCVLLEDQADDLTLGPPADVPTEVQLPPRTYTVRAVAPGYRPRRPSWFVDLYGPRSLTLEFDEDGGEATRTAAGVPRDLSLARRPPPHLRAVADDRWAVVEILDELGRRAASGVGAATVEEPGRYRVRATVAGGGADERRVELDPSDALIVRLEPESGLIPLEALAQTTSAGTLNVVAHDRRRHGAATAIELRGTYSGASEHLTAAPDGMTTQQRELEPGGYLLTVRAGDVEVTAPLYALDEAPLTVVLELDERGRPLIVVLRSPTHVEPDARTAAARRMDAAQRFLAAGRLHDAWTLMREAPLGQDPLSDCLLAYLVLQRGAEVSRSLIADLPEQLPDRWVLAALAEGDSRMAERALLFGVPLFDLGLRALADLTGDRTAEMLVEHRVGGQAITTFAGEAAAAAAAKVGAGALVG